MDDPAPPGDTGFDAFQSAQPSFDAFGVSSGGNNVQQQIATTKTDSFDAFGEMTSAEASSQPQELRAHEKFDAFSSAPTLSTQQNNTFDAFGYNNNANSMNDMFGNMNMDKMPTNDKIMDGGRTKKIVQDDDGFGDFADGNTATAQSKNDPLSNLISLDGLTKNSKKEDKSSESILFNKAAKDYASNHNQIKAGSSKMSADFAFHGVDGLNKVSMASKPQISRAGNQPVMMNSGGNNGMMNSMNTMNSMGMNNMSNSMSSMGTMMNSNDNMKAFGGNSMQMNSMGMMGGNNGMNNMGGQQQSTMMMGGNNGMNNMGGQHQSTMMMGGNNGMNNMGGQQESTLMMRGDGVGMGGQGNNMMGGQQQQQSTMMGGQPMGGGW